MCFSGKKAVLHLLFQSAYVLLAWRERGCYGRVMLFWCWLGRAVLPVKMQAVEFASWEAS